MEPNESKGVNSQANTRPLHENREQTSKKTLVGPMASCQKATAFPRRAVGRPRSSENTSARTTTRAGNRPAIAPKRSLEKERFYTDKIMPASAMKEYRHTFRSFVDAFTYCAKKRRTGSLEVRISEGLTTDLTQF